MTKQRRYYPLLDGVRGLAAIAVMFRHMDLFGLGAPSQTYLAVDLFFLLSGSVIANAYEEKLTRDMGVGRFMLLRVARLYPMIILGMCLGALNAAFGEMYPALTVPLWLALPAAILLLPVGPMLGTPNLDGPTWSLSYEFLANAGYALAIRRLSLGILSAICAVSAAVLVVAAVYKGHLDTGYTVKSLAFGLGRVGFSFFAGVILYRLHARGLLHVPMWLRGSRGTLLAAVLTLGALVITPPTWARPACALTSVFLIFPAIVVLGLESERAPARACKALGAVSYPLYLIHSPLILITRHALLMRHLPLLYIGIIGAPLLILAAWLLDRYFDGPARKALTRLVAAKPALKSLAA